MQWMSARERARGQALPKASLEAYGAPRTAIGLGAPAESGFSDIENEETVVYGPSGSLASLLAKCGGSANAASTPGPAVVATTTSEIRPRDASFHTAPHFPDDSHPELQLPVESNLHQIDDEAIQDSLAPTNPDVRVVHLRVGRGSSHPPNDISPSLVRFRPSRRRWLFAKVLFLTIAIGVALLVLSEVSAAAKVPWLDARPLVGKGWRLAKEKIPWNRLPRIPKL